MSRNTDDKMQYINEIARNVQCNRTVRKAIRSQLLADINVRLSEGEEFKDVKESMGTAKEVAQVFNDNMPENEKRKYAIGRIVQAIIFIILAMSVFLAFLAHSAPKSYPIEDSTYFEKEALESAVRDTIELLDNGDYEAVRQNAVGEMQDSLEDAKMEEAKRAVSKKWGNRVSIDDIEATEVINKDRHLAVCISRVTYEKVSVVYTITYNADMQICGLYMR